MFVLKVFTQNTLGPDFYVGEGIFQKRETIGKTLVLDLLSAASRNSLNPDRSPLGTPDSMQVTEHQSCRKVSLRPSFINLTQVNA